MVGDLLLRLRVATFSVSLLSSNLTVLFTMGSDCMLFETTSVCVDFLVSQVFLTVVNESEVREASVPCDSSFESFCKGIVSLVSKISELISEFFLHLFTVADVLSSESFTILFFS